MRQRHEKLSHPKKNTTMAHSQTLLRASSTPEGGWGTPAPGTGPRPPLLLLLLVLLILLVRGPRPTRGMKWSHRVTSRKTTNGDELNDRTISIVARARHAERPLWRTRLGGGGPRSSLPEGKALTGRGVAAWDPSQGLGGGFNWPRGLGCSESMIARNISIARG